MSTLPALVLALGPFLLGNPPSSATPDTARLRELLHDRQNPQRQSQAALLLVQRHGEDADQVIRQGLQHTESPDIFTALAEALRLCHDSRFNAELLAALQGGRPKVRQPAAETLAVLGDAAVQLQLQTLAEDARLDPAVRQAALWTLGHCGRMGAVPILLRQLTAEQESIRQAAAQALEDLTGLNYGTHEAFWQAWWSGQKDRTKESWLIDRLVYQSCRARRLEGELGRARDQVLQLHQNFYARLNAADRLAYVQTLTDHEDAAVRTLAVSWCGELLSTTDAVGQRLLSAALLHFTYDADLEVQRRAVLSLGRISDSRTFDRLRTLMLTSRPLVRAAAARAMTQQAQGSGPEAQARQRQVVPSLQKALEDTALEVVVEAAEDLGALGVPESGPVLTVLLRHPAESVRLTAAQALERVADPFVLEGLGKALDDPSATVRFSLVGAMGHVAAAGPALAESQRTQLVDRLKDLLVRDTDPGVRSRAATVLGECGSSAALPFLWQRLQATEDGRVQDKAWAAMLKILIRSANFDLLTAWDAALVKAGQPARRVQLLGEVYAAWKKEGATASLAGRITEMLVPLQLEQAKWSAALPLIRELLARPDDAGARGQRLNWLLNAGKQALQEGNRPEALRMVQDAQPFLAGQDNFADAFEKLRERASLKP
jgi:HEAT repeat protein